VLQADIEQKEREAGGGQGVWRIASSMSVGGQSRTSIKAREKARGAEARAEATIKGQLLGQYAKCIKVNERKQALTFSIRSYTLIHLSYTPILCR
jgi:hypothetical protein